MIKVIILQINTQKRETALREALEQQSADVLLIQEPYITAYGPVNDDRWIRICTERNSRNRIRAITYIRRSSPIAGLATPEERLTREDMAAFSIGDLTVVNVYNNRNCPYNNRGTLFELMKTLDEEGQEERQLVLAGDMNLHHYDWDSGVRSEVQANELVTWMTECDMELRTRRDVPTHDRGRTIDLVIASTGLAARLEMVEAEDDEEEREFTTDHRSQKWTVELVLPEDVSLLKLPFASGKGDKRYNVKKTDWEEFDEVLEEEIKNINPRIPTETYHVEEQVEQIHHAMVSTMERTMKKVRIGPWTKPYWNTKIKEMREELVLALRRARNGTDEDKDEARKLYHAYRRTLKEEKYAHWNNFLSELRGVDIWKVNRFIRPRSPGGTKATPHIKKPDGTLTTTIGEKRQALFESLFPEKETSTECPPMTGASSKWPKLTEPELNSAIAELPSKKAPGPDGITGKILKQAWKNDKFKRLLKALMTGCVDLGYHPREWRVGKVITLRKPGKKDYNNPRSYRPITLLNTISKLLERIIQKRLSYLVEDKLPKAQYGGRQGYSAPDAVLEIVHDAKRTSTFREDKTDVLSAMMIDIQGAFDNVSLDTLLNQMEKMEVPDAARRWVYHFMTDRKITMVIDEREGPEVPLNSGIPQGSPISPLLFLIYSTPLYGVIEEAGAKASGFIDDITIRVRGKVEENAKRLSIILDKCVKWAHDNGTKIDLGAKLGFIHFKNTLTDQELENSKLKVPGEENDDRTAEEKVKLLGIILDKRLSFKEHIKEVTRKTKVALYQITRLGGTIRGMTGGAVRSMYLACVRPIMEYGLEVWAPKLLKKNKDDLEIIQNKALRTILGAYRTTPVLILQREAGIMPINARLQNTLRKKVLRLMTRLNDNNPTRELAATRDAISVFYAIRNKFLKASERRKPMPPLKMKPPWENISRDEEYCNLRREIYKEREETIQKSNEIATTLWDRQYLEGRKGAVYRYLTDQKKACTTDVKKMMTKNIIQNQPRRILSKITQFRTNHGNYGQYFKKFNITKDSYDCECGELETVSHILVSCPITSDKRHMMKRVSPNLVVRTLLNTRRGLLSVASFLGGSEE